MARDLERYLEGQPVEARAPSPNAVDPNATVRTVRARAQPAARTAAAATSPSDCIGAEPSRA